MSIVLHDLKTKLTPLEMLTELCTPCPFYYETKVLDGRASKPECRIGRQHLCMQATVIYLATGHDNEALAKSPPTITVPAKRGLQP